MDHHPDRLMIPTTSPPPPIGPRLRKSRYAQGGGAPRRWDALIDETVPGGGGGGVRSARKRRWRWRKPMSEREVL